MKIKFSTIGFLMTATLLPYLAFAATLSTYDPTLTYFDPTLTTTTTDPLATTTSSTGTTTTSPTSTSTGTTSTGSTTTDPNGTTSTTSTIIPTYDYSTVLQPASSGGTVNTTTETTQPTTDPTRTTSTIDPNANVSTDPTTPASSTPPRTYLPPPATVESTPRDPVTAATCPPFNPFPEQQTTATTQCTVKETTTIIPQIPIPLMVGPLVGLLVFWWVISLLNRNQTNLEKRFSQKHLQTAHAQTVAKNRYQTYHQMLDFLTKEFGNKVWDDQSFNDLSARLELLSTPEMQKINSQLQVAYGLKDQKLLKVLIRDLGMQIKKDL